MKIIVILHHFEDVTGTRTGPEMEPVPLTPLLMIIDESQQQQQTVSLHRYWNNLSYCLLLLLLLFCCSSSHHLLSPPLLHSIINLFSPSLPSPPSVWPSSLRRRLMKWGREVALCSCVRGPYRPTCPSLHLQRDGVQPGNVQRFGFHPLTVQPSLTRSIRRPQEEKLLPNAMTAVM